MHVRPHHRLRAVATAGAAVVAATAAAAAAAARPPIADPVDPFPVNRQVEHVVTLPAVHITGGTTDTPGDLGPIERVIDPDDPLIHTDDLPGKYRVLEQLYPDPLVLGQVINSSSLCPEEQEIRYHYITHLAPKVAQARMLYKGGPHISDHDGWTCHSLGTWIVGSSLADDTVALDAAGVPPARPGHRRQAFRRGRRRGGSAPPPPHGGVPGHRRDGRVVGGGDAGGCQRRHLHGAEGEEGAGGGAGQAGGWGGVAPLPPVVGGEHGPSGRAVGERGSNGEETEARAGRQRWTQPPEEPLPPFCLSTVRRFTSCHSIHRFVIHFFLLIILLEYTFLVNSRPLWH